MDSKFDHIAVIIKKTKVLKAVTIKQLQGRLQAYEEKQKKKHGIKEQLLKIKVNTKKKEESFDNNKR